MQDFIYVAVIIVFIAISLVVTSFFRREEMRESAQKDKE